MTGRLDDGHDHEILVQFRITQKIESIKFRIMLHTV